MSDEIRVMPLFKCITCPKHTDLCDKIANAELKSKREKGIKTVTKHLRTDSLCWCCDKAIHGGCDWIDKKQPVRHWDADKRIFGTDTISYHVYDCPEFVRYLPEWCNP